MVLEPMPVISGRPFVSASWTAGNLSEAAWLSPSVQTSVTHTASSRKVSLGNDVAEAARHALRAFGEYLNKLVALFRKNQELADQSVRRSSSIRKKLRSGPSLTMGKFGVSVRENDGYSERCSENAADLPPGYKVAALDFPVSPVDCWSHVFWRPIVPAVSTP
jgi:hypothetical protein